MGGYYNVPHIVCYWLLSHQRTSIVCGHQEFPVTPEGRVAAPDTAVLQPLHHSVTDGNLNILVSQQCTV